MRGAAEQQPADVVAASYAPTLVAPLEPLTRQERLLLRVVHQGSQEQRAMLDARARDEQLIAERADVDAFFKRPELPRQDQ